MAHWLLAPDCQDLNDWEKKKKEPISSLVDGSFARAPASFCMPV